MVRKKQNAIGRITERLATAVTKWSGSSIAFTLAFSVIVVWVLTGPLFGFSDTWQLDQHRHHDRDVPDGVPDSAIPEQGLAGDSPQAERDRRGDAGASNRLIDVESLTEQELNLLRRHYTTLVSMSKRDATLTESHSIEEAEHRHKKKLGAK